MTAVESIERPKLQFMYPSAKTSGRTNLTFLIAWRNLVHELVRFAVTFVGIAFSTILMGIQLGMLLNFMHTTSAIVDHAGADLWVTAHGVRAVDLATPMDRRRRFQALAVKGVAAAEYYLLQFGNWKRRDGVRENVIIVGVDLNAKMGLPWAMEPGRSVRDALSVPNGVIIDRLYAKKLDVGAIDQVFEINDHRSRVTGFTNGIRTFTQSPYIFTSLQHARLLASQADKVITYILIRTTEGQSADTVARALSVRMPDVDVLTTHEFSSKTRNYWLFSTGAGVTMISAAVLSLLVGVVIVAQTLYASTLDRLPEYATIRAMGASRGYLYKIVIKQAVIGGFLGYVAGIVIVLLLAHLGQNSSASPEVPWWLALSIGVVTIVMCVGASVLSLNKITSIDPVRAFR